MNGPFDRKRAPSPSAARPARSPSGSPPAGRGVPTSTVSRPEEEEARSSSKYRAALEKMADDASLVRVLVAHHLPIEGDVSTALRAVAKTL